MTSTRAATASLAPPRRCAKRRRSGFTLVEVLATLALVGIVLPVAMQAISVALKTSSTAKRQLEAATLAETKLEEIIATGEWQFGVLSGDFGEEFEGYRWEAQVLQRESASLSELIVHVTWDGRGGEQGIHVATLVYLTGYTDEGAASGLGSEQGGGP